MADQFGYTAPMDDTERRLAAVETLLIEIAAELTDEQRERIAARIGEGGALDADHEMIRNGALGLLQDGGRRLQAFLIGLRVTPEAND